jgi:hypothetical protein
MENGEMVVGLKEGIENVNRFFGDDIFGWMALRLGVSLG